MESTRVAKEVGPYRIQGNWLLFRDTNGVYQRHHEFEVGVNAIREIQNIRGCEGPRYFVHIFEDQLPHEKRFRGIFCFDEKGHLLWEIDHTIHPSENLGPFPAIWTGMMIYKDKLVAESNYRTFTAIDPQTGKCLGLVKID